MKWLLYFALGIAAAIAFLAWGFFRIRKRTADAAAALHAVRESEIPGLVEECVHVCSEKLGVSLDLRNLEESAENLDYVLEPKQRSRMKTAFEAPGHTGHFVMPLGAYIGELVRTHKPGARWVPREGGGLGMDIPQGEATLTMFPFDKVLKHAAMGKTGDIVAYLNVALGRTSPS